jgi:hypothetical protein
MWREFGGSHEVDFEDISTAKLKFPEKPLSRAVIQSAIVDAILPKMVEEKYAGWLY